MFNPPAEVSTCWRRSPCYFSPQLGARTSVALRHPPCPRQLHCLRRRFACSGSPTNLVSVPARFLCESLRNCPSAKYLAVLTHGRRRSPPWIRFVFQDSTNELASFVLESYGHGVAVDTGLGEPHWRPTASAARPPGRSARSVGAFANAHVEPVT